MNIFSLCWFGCAPESKYSGGSGSFKDYESLASYQNKDVKYSPKYMHTQNSNFSSSLIANDNQAVAMRERTRQFGNKTNTNRSGTKGIEKQAAKPSQTSYTPPVVGSGHFKPTKSLLGGMRDSEAIQRATMRPYTVRGKTYRPHPVKVGDTFDGIASWYGPDFHAKATSNGETYNMHAHTAAHKTLPMNTIVSVFNKDNGKSTVVRINDRGPFVEGRIIDLSNVAARDIQMVGKGVANVRIEVVGFGGDLKNNNSKPIMNAQKTSKDSKTQNSEKIAPHINQSLLADTKDTSKLNANTITTPSNMESKNQDFHYPSGNTQSQIISNKSTSHQPAAAIQEFNQQVNVNSHADSSKTEVIEEELEQAVMPMILPSQNPQITKRTSTTQKDIPSNPELNNSTSTEKSAINDDAKNNKSTEEASNNQVDNTVKYTQNPTMSDLDNTIQKLKDSTNQLQAQQHLAQSMPIDIKQQPINNSSGESLDPYVSNQKASQPLESEKKESKPSESFLNDEVKKGTHMVSLNVFSQGERANHFKEEMQKSFDGVPYTIDIVQTKQGLYRVALRGFKSMNEAKQFIAKYNIAGHVVAE